MGKCMCCGITGPRKGNWYLNGNGIAANDGNIRFATCYNCWFVTNCWDKNMYDSFDSNLNHSNLLCQLKTVHA